jgi:hypothetical protein
MCHVNHIYTTLGCIIQDMEYMVGRQLTKNSSDKDLQGNNRDRI